MHIFCIFRHVCVYFMHIYAYLCKRDAYLCIFTHICVYLCIAYLRTHFHTKTWIYCWWKIVQQGYTPQGVEVNASILNIHLSCIVTGTINIHSDAVPELPHGTAVGSALRAFRYIYIYIYWSEGFLNGICGSCAWCSRDLTRCGELLGRRRRRRRRRRPPPPRFPPAQQSISSDTTKYKFRHNKV